MNKKTIPQIIFNGLAVVIPFGAVAYLFLRIIRIIGKLIQPLSPKMGIERILGELTLTIIATTLLLIFIVIVGYVMQMPFMNGFRNAVERIAFKFFPSLERIQAVAEEKARAEIASESWRPLILSSGGKYQPAYFIERNEGLLTLFIVKGSDVKEGEILITDVKGKQYVEISHKEIKNSHSHYGKGYLTIIAKATFIDLELLR